MSNKKTIVEKDLEIVSGGNYYDDYNITKGYYCPECDHYFGPEISFDGEYFCPKCDKFVTPTIRN